MKIWVVMAKVEELQARSVDKVFDSKEKAEQYSKEQDKHAIFSGGTISMGCSSCCIICH
jgi:hypothetical protein